MPGGELSPEQARGLIGRTWDLTLDLLDARSLPEARPMLRLLLTSRRSVMENFASALRMRVAGWAAVAAILALNAVLLGQLMFG